MADQPSYAKEASLKGIINNAALDPTAADYAREAESAKADLASVQMSDRERQFLLQHLAQSTAKASGATPSKVAFSQPAAPTPTPTPASSPSNNPVSTSGAAAIERNNVAAAALDKILVQQQNIINSAVTSLEGTRNDAALVKSTEELAKANSQRQASEFASNIGTNPDAANFALQKLVEQSSQLFDQQRAVAERLENAANPRTMFDRPLRWVADYLLEPANQKRHQAISAKLDSTNKQIKFLNDVTQDSARTMEAIAQTKTTATASAAANIARAAVDADVAKLQMESTRLNSESLLTTTRLRNNGLDILFKQRDQEMQEAQLAESRRQRELQTQILQQNLADKQTEAQTKQSFLTLYNLGADNTGTPKFKTYEELNTYMQVNPSSKETVAINYNNGYAQSVGAPPTIGSTPYQALKFTATSGAKLDPSRQQLMTRLKGVYDTVQLDPALQPLLKNKDTAQATTNTAILKQVDMAHKDITKGGDNNPYKAPPLASLLAVENLAATYWGKNILTPLLQAGSTELPFTKAIDLLMMDVKAGKISAAQADSELGFWGEQIKNLNNDMYRYNATAGIPNMKGTIVPVNVPVTGWFTNTLTQMATIGSIGPENTELKRIDLTDPVARSSLFNKVQATTLKPTHMVTGKVGVE